MNPPGPPEIAYLIITNNHMFDIEFDEQIAIKRAQERSRRIERMSDGSEKAVSVRIFRVHINQLEELEILPPGPARLIPKEAE